MTLSLTFSTYLLMTRKLHQEPSHPFLTELNTEQKTREKRPSTTECKRRKDSAVLSNRVRFKALTLTVPKAAFRFGCEPSTARGGGRAAHAEPGASRAASHQLSRGRSPERAWSAGTCSSRRVASGAKSPHCKARRKPRPSGQAGSGRR